MNLVWILHWFCPSEQFWYNPQRRPTFRLFCHEYFWCLNKIYCILAYPVQKESSIKLYRKMVTYSRKQLLDSIPQEWVINLYFPLVIWSVISGGFLSRTEKQSQWLKKVWYPFCCANWSNLILFTAHLKRYVSQNLLNSLQKYQPKWQFDQDE